MDKLKLIIADLKDEQLLEYVWLMLKYAKLDPFVWRGLQTQLKLLVGKLQIKYASQQQANANRLFFWLRYKVTAPAYSNNHATLQYLLSRALMDAGLLVAMSLERSPRPTLQLACHLPLLTEGYNEWADVILLNSAVTSLRDLPILINHYMPQGLCILEIKRVHEHASSVSNLCQRAHWQWTCKNKQQDNIDYKINKFIQSKQFNIEKSTKVDGKNIFVQTDIRPYFEQCLWDGSSLLFQTKVTPGQAVNPNKMLAAILGTTSPIGELARTKLELTGDPRLLQVDKFEIKLHNMYEDAIVLNAGTKY